MNALLLAPAALWLALMVFVFALGRSAALGDRQIREALRESARANQRREDGRQ